MSRVLMIIAFLGIAFIAEVTGHGHLSLPITRDMTLGKRQDEQNAPNMYPVISDFVCRNYSASPSSQWTTLTAGSTTPIKWDLEAPHPGDCFAYITYDGDNVIDTKKKWFKIAQFSQCNLQNFQTQQLTIPSYLPSCDHCILRWEWYALHLQSINIVEFYSQCADVRIIGKSNGQLPTPQVTIPGHLPMDANRYRSGYGYENLFMTGPPIATIGGSSYDCVDTYGSSCIAPSPTNNVCEISSQRCVTATTYQACGVGATSTAWAAEQSCQTGLVCANHPTIPLRITCTYPSSVPTPAPAPAPTPAPVPATTGKAAAVTTGNPLPSTTGRTSPATTGRVSAITSGSRIVTTGRSDPSTTGSRTPIASTTAAAPAATPVPSPPSSGVCNKLGSMVCVGESSYSTCSRATEKTLSWSQAQYCPTGLKCSPSGDYIYCLNI